MNALLQASFYGQAHIVQYLIDHAAGNLTTYGMVGNLNKDSELLSHKCY